MLYGVVTGGVLGGGTYLLHDTAAVPYSWTVP